MIKISKAHRVMVIILCVWTSLVAVVSGCFCGFNMLYASTYVRGWSMRPTLNENVENDEKGDRVYYKRFSNQCSRGDIVILNVTNNPNFLHKDGGDYIIKRVIGVAGDTVNIEYDEAAREYRVVVYAGEQDGKVMYTRPYKLGGYLTYAQFRAYVDNPDNASKVTARGVKVGEGEVYVLGDNWDDSKDSSAVGTLKQASVVGNVEIVVRKGQNSFVQILKHIFG